ncbi:MAG: ABC transporter permease [Chloroflexota bacterium]|nr:ABC transporter permease [Chloroflexota bacterium]
MSTVAAGRKTKPRSLFGPSLTGPLITLLLTFVLFSLFVPHFCTMRSLSGIVSAATLTGMITVGITMLMIAGEFDLSVGPMMAMGGFLYGLHSVEGGSPAWALFLALLVPALMGALNGIIVARTRIPSFIATLATRFIFSGVVWIYSGGQMFQTIEKAPIYDVFNGRLDFVAEAVKGANFRTSTLWLIGMVLLFQYVLSRTGFGNHVFAVGGNPGAAAARGVNVKQVKVICFVISAVLSGFTGVLLFSQYKTVRIATGTGEELNAIAAAVVGGTLLDGGAGTIIGALLGVLIISMLRTGVVLLDLIPADNFEAIVGATIVAAAIINNWIRRRA